MPLATERSRIAELRATGALVTCRLTRYDGDRAIEAWQCRVFGVHAGADAGTEGEEGGVAR